MARPLAVAVGHIIENIDRIARYIDGKTEQDYLQDSILSDAVERCVERISEASRSIPDDVKTNHPTVPWRDIASIGNILRHNYDAVGMPTVWKIATLDIPALRPVILAIRAAIKDAGV